LHLVPSPIREVASYCQEDQLVNINFLDFENLPYAHPALEVVTRIAACWQEGRYVVLIVFLPVSFVFVTYNVFSPNHPFPRPHLS
jgi:hypothetical protein